MNLPIPIIQITQSPERDIAAREGWSLLAMLSILGLILVFSMLLIIVLRRTRSARQIESRAPEPDPVDPWAESANRMSDSIIEYDESDEENEDEDGLVS